jgi:enoyl-CoA hydratase/carnithine racemase
MNDFHTIHYKREENIGTLTLTRPEKRSAQNPLMWKELARLGVELLSDDTLRCLVVTGEGPTFSAGIDLAEGMVGLGASRIDRPDELTIAEGKAAANTFSWIPKLG